MYKLCISWLPKGIPEWREGSPLLSQPDWTAKEWEEEEEGIDRASSLSLFAFLASIDVCLMGLFCFVFVLSLLGCEPYPSEKGGVPFRSNGPAGRAFLNGP